MTTLHNYQDRKDGPVTGQEQGTTGQKRHCENGPGIWTQAACIVAYLGFTLLANLSVTWFGPWIAPLNALLFIGFDLTARDTLHEAWSHRHLWRKMLALIAAGSILSYLINRNSQQVAIASFAAFLVAGLVDTIVYGILADGPRRARANASNLFSAAFDTLIFSILAFSEPPPPSALALQYTAKAFGGFLWSFILVRKE